MEPESKKLDSGLKPGPRLDSVTEDIKQRVDYMEKVVKDGRHERAVEVANNLHRNEEFGEAGQWRFSLFVQC